MRKIGSLFLVLLLFSLASTVVAMEFDFDSLFEDDLFEEFEAETAPERPEDVLLVNEGWELGGNYNFSLQATRTYSEDDEPQNSLRTNLGTTLYLDSRPNPDFRVFGKVGVGYKEKNSGAGKLDLELLELFSDFNYDNKVFFRGGKQKAEWGVGYFFSPADVINVGQIDPQDPKGAREGALTLKMHYPHKSNNFYLYTLFDGVEKPEEIALAPKLEYVFGKTEMGVGAFYRKGKAPRIMSTISSSLGDIDFFGEAVLSKGSDKLFFEQNQLVEKDDVFFHGTLGAAYSYNDSNDFLNLSGAFQYYFNGEGYKDQNQIKDFHEWLRKQLILDQDFRKSFDQNNLLNTGRHYLASLLRWNNIFALDLSLTTTWTTNLSDRSGLVSATLALPSISKLTPTIGVGFNYGELGTEFGLMGKETTVFAGVSIGGGSF